MEAAVDILDKSSNTSLWGCPFVLVPNRHRGSAAGTTVDYTGPSSHSSRPKWDGWMEIWPLQTGTPSPRPPTPPPVVVPRACLLHRDLGLEAAAAIELRMPAEMRLGANRHLTGSHHRLLTTISTLGGAVEDWRRDQKGCKEKQDYLDCRDRFSPNSNPHPKIHQALRGPGKWKSNDGLP